MRHRIDAGSGLVAVGAAVLLVSLFLDWYEPGLSAWTSFEVLDLALAALAIAALVGAAGPPGPGAAMVRWGPLVSLAAFLLVASQLIDPPPGVEADRQAGAWVALAAALAMSVGSALAVASISVTVDVRSRDRRRATAVDHRAPGEAAGDEEGADRPEEAGGGERDGRDEHESGQTTTDAWWTASDDREAVADRRSAPQGREPARPASEVDLGTTQAFETVERPGDAADTDADNRGDRPADDADMTPPPRDPPPRG